MKQNVHYAVQHLHPQVQTLHYQENRNSEGKLEANTLTGFRRSKSVELLYHWQKNSSLQGFRFLLILWQQ